MTSGGLEMGRGIGRASVARRRWGWRAVGPIAAVATAVGALGLAAAGPSTAHVGLARSSGIERVGSIDLAGAMSLQFSSVTPHAYVHTREGGGTVHVLDVADPTKPRIVGTTAVASGPYMEDMQLGERTSAGSVTSFVLVRQGDNLAVVDVSKPKEPYVRSTLALPSHTYECASPECTYAFATWSRQDQLTFSVVDLSDLDAPEVITTEPSPVGILHDWYRDEAGVMWALGANGIAAYDASDPSDPTLLNASDINGVKSAANPYNDRLQFHGAARPNARRFTGTALAPSYDAGNVLFVSEEGNNADCTDSFQTWFVPSLSGVALALPSDVPTNAALGTITPISNWSLLEEPTTMAPDPALCSVHWFDYHEAGFVALPTYASGTRVLDVRDPANLRQVAFHHTLDTMAIQSYWVPERKPNGRTTGRSTNLIYTADAGLVANPFLLTPHESGRIDVFRVDQELLRT